MSAQVAGKRVVIYDDMIRTGGSLLDAARGVPRRRRGRDRRDRDARRVPGRLAREASQRPACSARSSTTDSHPRAVALAGDFLQVDSTATLLAEHLMSNR